ncbi:S41 family peptidase [Chitinophagaceae bacterium LB-8]|uniref:S41 family peptidase n=1 Tax=Paraflavisolibacter caeni TaxID=2982496 RepID=A0A9X2XSW0_9BACT|nr:S41 family peptidase [Paraflavisolibacter caeni]MCU7547667.1 S41 family peptidase [Paraflavisolibacter caeni]
MFYKKLLTAICLLLASYSFGQAITPKEKKAIFDSTRKLFATHYHFKSSVKPTLEYLDKQWKSGRYTALNTIDAYKDSLSRDLKHFTQDGHLNFFYLTPDIANDTAPKPQIPWGLINDKFLNNGFTKLEILPGNIGYIRIEAFGSPDQIVPSAFSFVQNTDALIIDLRGNGGGMLSNEVISYLLPEDSILVNTIFWNDHTDSIYTYRKLAGPRYLDKPVYLLTDKGTFSSAEEFAYDLQNMKRVMIIGETTGGGANPGGTMPVYRFKDGSRLDLYVSMAHVENPITKTNWEVKGVQPDVQVPAKDALQKAHMIALEQLKQKEPNNEVQKRYKDIIERVGVGR